VLSADWLRRRFAAAPAIAAIGGDDRIAGAGPATLTPASVLVPIVTHARELTVLFTRRTAHLRDHSGQISFPGGRAEPSDDSPRATAVREAFEEIGLEAERIELLGALPEYCTRTGFCVTPVVGLVAPPLELRPDAFEVDEVFEVPLAFLLDPANHQRHAREIQGRPAHYYAIPYRDYYIWGATAGMLVNLYRFLSAV
jgi:8-oxo-dGTP pyrophosphatase MutT (NUDIX family)